MNMQPTPLQEYPVLANAVGILELYIKREDLNTSGSHKDRALFPYVDKLTQEGERQFCLTSSGNLAISAACYAHRHNQIQFHLFLPSSLSSTKKERLDSFKSYNVRVYWSRAPKTDAVRFSRENNIRLLRGSTDNEMLSGYHRLAYELHEQTKGKMGSLYMAVSSGTALVGLWEGSKRFRIQDSGFRMPQFHIVQTVKVHPIAAEFDKDFIPANSSLATAIVDRIAYRKPYVVEIVKESGGGGWVVGDEEITNAKSQIATLTGMDVSSESAMALTGLQKAIRKGFTIQTPTVLMFTGK